MTNFLSKINQTIINAIHDNKVSKSDLAETVKQLAIENESLKRRIKVDKKSVSRAEHMKTNHNRAKSNRRSELLVFLESQITQACFTRAQIIANCLFTFDTKYAQSTITTYLSDCMSLKYHSSRVFKRLVLCDKHSKVLYFADLNNIKSAAQMRAERTQAEIDKAWNAQA